MPWLTENQIIRREGAKIGHRYRWRETNTNIHPMMDTGDIFEIVSFGGRHQQRYEIRIIEGRNADQYTGMMSVKHLEIIFEIGERAGGSK